MEVKLANSDGSTVGRFDIPDFLDSPYVLFWGSRTFVLDKELSKEFKVKTYKEAFCFSILTENKELRNED